MQGSIYRKFLLFICYINPWTLAKITVISNTHLPKGGRKKAIIFSSDRTASLNFFSSSKMEVFITKRTKGAEIHEVMALCSYFCPFNVNSTTVYSAYTFWMNLSPNFVSITMVRSGFFVYLVWFFSNMCI